MEVISKHQKALADEISKHQKLAYQELIVPRCETLKAELGADRPIVISDDVVVLYYELLFQEYMQQQSLDEKTLVLLMSYRPIVYHLESIKRTYKEIEDWNSQLEETIDSIFDNEFKHARVQLLKQTMKLAVSHLEMSAITYFHYFIGIEFYRPYIGISRDELIKLIGRRTCAFININYKLASDVYVYHQPAITLGNSFMTASDIEAFKPIEKLEATYYKDMITIDELSDDNVIALRYSDDCFTLISNGSSIRSFNRDEAQRFLDGAINSTLKKEQLETYAASMYHRELPRLLTNELQSELQNVSLDSELSLPSASDVFSKHVKPLLSRFTNMTRGKYKRFIDRLQEIDLGIEKQERDLLMLYLSLYTFIDWNYNEFVSYFWAYFEDLAEDI